LSAREPPGLSVLPDDDPVEGLEGAGKTCSQREHLSIGSDVVRRAASSR
jgi:hypothetical protein